MVNEEDLTTSRMLELMAVNQNEGPPPLYMHTVLRILRDMRMQQQEQGTPFRYTTFKQLLMNSGLIPSQLAPLQQRLDTLESFMPKTVSSVPKKKKKSTASSRESVWAAKV
jgi:hypothetical protein